MEDSEQARLVRQSVSGDPKAFAQLMRLHGEPMAALIRRMVADPHHGEDVMQETMLQAWRSLGQLRDPARFKQWLLQIARHRCHDHRRSRQGRESPGGTDVLAQADSRLGREGAHESATEIADAMRDLPASQRESVRLFYFEDLTIAEISRRLDRPSGTIKRWLHHGRDALRRSLADEREDNSGDK